MDTLSIPHFSNFVKYPLTFHKKYGKLAIMYHYNKIQDKLTYKGKEVKRSHKTYWDRMCGYAIYLVSEGKNLSNIPVISDIFPRISEILIRIDDNEDLSSKMARAEKTRLAILKEDLLQAVEVYKIDPSKENNEKVVILEKTYSKMHAQQEQEQDITLVVEKYFPDDYWEDSPAPEHPRINGKDVSLEEYENKNSGS